MRAPSQRHKEFSLKIRSPQIWPINGYMSPYASAICRPPPEALAAILTGISTDLISHFCLVRGGRAHVGAAARTAFLAARAEVGSGEGRPITVQHIYRVKTGLGQKDERSATDGALSRGVTDQDARSAWAD